MRGRCRRGRDGLRFMQGCRRRGCDLLRFGDRGHRNRCGHLWLWPQLCDLGAQRLIVLGSAAFEPEHERCNQGQDDQWQQHDDQVPDPHRWQLSRRRLRRRRRLRDHRGFRNNSRRTSHDRSRRRSRRHSGNHCVRCSRKRSCRRPRKCSRRCSSMRPRKCSRGWFGSRSGKRFCTRSRSCLRNCCCGSFYGSFRGSFRGSNLRRFIQLGRSRDQRGCANAAELASTSFAIPRAVLVRGMAFLAVFGHVSSRRTSSSLDGHELGNHRQQVDHQCEGRVVVEGSSIRNARWPAWERR